MNPQRPQWGPCGEQPACRARPGTCPEDSPEPFSPRRWITSQVWGRGPCLALASSQSPHSLLCFPHRGHSCLLRGPHKQQAQAPHHAPLPAQSSLLSLVPPCPKLNSLPARCTPALADSGAPGACWWGVRFFLGTSDSSSGQVLGVFLAACLPPGRDGQLCADRAAWGLYLPEPPAPHIGYGT